MVVGSGMIASAFAAFRESGSVVIFASGVSNSLETAPDAFERERKLLETVRSADPGPLLVYFGTCSADDPERQDTPYVQHKLAMEAMLAKSEGPWLILRVPLAIGRNPRSTTLAQFLHDRIAHDQGFEVWEGASRYPIDVEDLVRIGRKFIGDPAMWNRRINVALRPFPVLEFVRVMEDIVGKKARCTVVRKGQRFDLECPEVARVAAELNLDLGERYLDRVLRKYFGAAPSPA